MTHSLLVIDIGGFAAEGAGMGEMTEAIDILLTGAAFAACGSAVLDDTGLMMAFVGCSAR